MAQASPPLEGIRVIEFTHMVMGPTVGVILADLGAEVIKVEPLGGDNTRRLGGSGAGYFPMYNRNKKSICVDLKSPQGIEVVHRLVADADVVIENFRPGAMDRLGFGYAQLSALNPRLVYCSLKGFLSGPYEQRTALDEVTQMMGGLAYMTGLPDRPMRAGSSVIDITGGMFGVIGILAALERRHRSGQGEQVTSSLFETTAFMVGQHMAQQAVSGEVPPPMSVRRSAWSVYDIFETADGERVFVGVVSDTLWQRFCEAFGLAEFAADPGLAKNNDRVRQRDRILPVIEALFRGLDKETLMARLESAGVPFAPINRPADLFDDPHLNATGALQTVTLTDGDNAGQTTRLPALPLELHGAKFTLRRDIPRAGEHTREVLAALGYDEERIAALLADGRVAAGT
ncbi:CaiB/BaiF CoA-transferase family protein [Pseudohaliea sp.]|uniref:CaiB/BaiF CoA transferase family protein n=1 Tax=Pseudohaliea sp. TaxID=2740289 RepID=UPI0032EDE348